MPGLRCSGIHPLTEGDLVTTTALRLNKPRAAIPSSVRFITAAPVFENRDIRAMGVSLTSILKNIYVPEGVITAIIDSMAGDQDRAEAQRRLRSLVPSSALPPCAHAWIRPTRTTSR